MTETSQSGLENMYTLVSVFGEIFASKGYPFKNIVYSIHNIFILFMFIFSVKCFQLSYKN